MSTKYKNIKDTPFEEILTEYSHIIKNVIFKYNLDKVIAYQNVMTYEDLESLGTVGLWNAYNRHDASKGANFSTYAYYKVLDVILNDVRNLTKCRCKWYKKMKEENSNFALYLPLDHHAIENMKEFSGGEKVLEKMILREQLEDLLCLIKPEQQRLLIDNLIYGITMEVIAKKEKVSLSRISQRVKKALQLIRDRKEFKSHYRYSPVNIDYANMKYVKCRRKPRKIRSDKVKQS